MDNHDDEYCFRVEKDGRNATDALKSWKVTRRNLTNSVVVDDDVDDGITMMTKTLGDLLLNDRSTM
jgi:hypothetical protein